MSDSSVIYAIELGGGHCSAAVFMDGTTTSQIAERRTPQVKENGTQVLLDTVCSLVDELAKESPPMQAVSVSFSAFLDLRDRPGSRTYGPLRDQEVMISAPHINDIRNMPFFEWLEGAGWGVPLHVENDVNAALRAASDFPTAVSINLGTGVAAAIKRENRIMHMPNTWSCYQIGHGFRWNLPEALTRKCNCGSIGCLEAAIGAWALTERYGTRPEDASPDVYEQMSEEVITYLTPAIIDLVEKSGVHTVIFSGGAARGFQKSFDFTGQLSERVRSERRAGDDVEIHVMDKSERAGLHGAALAAIDYEVIPARNL